MEPQAIRFGESKLFFDRRHALEGLGTKRATADQKDRIQSSIDGLNEDAGRLQPALVGGINVMNGGVTCKEVALAHHLPCRPVSPGS